MILTLPNRAVRVFPAPVSSAPVAYVIGGFEGAEETASAWLSPRASLAFIDCPQWNRDLSPWPAPACFRGGEAFLGGADRFLHELTEEIIPAVESSLAQPRAVDGGEKRVGEAFASVKGAQKREKTAENVPPASRSIVGVSLAGLFGVYALYRTDAFSVCASVSGSLWFDGFLDFLKSEPLRARPEKIYLSLGDREEFTRNQRLAAVGEATRAASAHFASRGIETALEMNPGNHFADHTLRLIRALDWLYR